jgi:hypothetical protein
LNGNESPLGDEGGSQPFERRTSALSADGYAPPHVAPTIQAHAALGAAAPAAGASAAAPNGIEYHGGSVIHAPVAYYIWYGTWTNDTGPAILTDFISNLGGSPYFGINSSYTDSSGHVRNVVTYGGEAAVGYARGLTIDGAKIFDVVAETIHSGGLPLDPNGVYFVLTSADVSVAGDHPGEGFCNTFCAWHGVGHLGSTNFQFAFVGNSDRCPGMCEAQTTSPNGNAGADAMASWIAHELEESATDPKFDAWFNATPVGVGENADKCEFNFGQEYQVPIMPVSVPGQFTARLAAATSVISPAPLPTTRANMRLGSRDYLIQTNWLNANGGLCSLGVRRLQVDVTGEVVTVTSQPDGISCQGLGCVHFFDPGTAVTLTASGGPSTVLKQWVGCDSVSGNTCNLTLTTDRAVTAVAAPLCSATCTRSCIAECIQDGGLPRTCTGPCRVLCGC